jgi:hypothetical protein
MGVKATANGGDGKKFEKPTEMIQQGIIADLTDKGMVSVTYAGKTKQQHKAYFTWILEEKDSEGRNKRVFQSFTVSLHEKARLRAIVKEFGVKITKDPANPKKELFDGQPDVELEQFIGLQRTLVMSTEDGDDGEPYVKILATQKPSNTKLEIPADFVRKQDKQ